MYKVAVFETSEDKQKQTDILETKDKKEAMLAYEGTILKYKYKFRGVLDTLYIKEYPDKVKFKYNGVATTVKIMEVK